MPQYTIAIKVDVTSYAATRDGVPRLLDIMAKAGVKGTFYFSMGPDTSGKGVLRIFTRKGYLGKLFRSGIPSPLTLPSMLYGTLLLPPMIGASFPHILERCASEGHEVGIHSWDYNKWFDYLPWLPKHLTAMELGRASALFEEILGHRAHTTAAPGWSVSEASLEVQDAMKLDYCSDCRGRAPFFPIWEGRRFATLQVPTTLPTMDELLDQPGVNLDNITDQYLSLLTPGVNILGINALLEGGALSRLFVNLLARLQQCQASFVTLGEIAAAHRDSAENQPIVMAKVPGFPGLAAIQG
jgi:peptidoglycan/xylan/chitin deacetylase (PgdA/CDA1 family)